MTGKRHSFAAIAGVAALVFVVVALDRRFASRSPEALVIATLPPEHNIRFDVRPSRTSAHQDAMRVGERVHAIASAGAHPLSSEEAESFAAAVSRRVSILLTASYDDWLEDVQRFTTRPDLNPGGEVDESFRLRWSTVSRTFELAPMSLGEISVRPLYVSGRRMDEPLTSALSRPIVRAEYPHPQDLTAARSTVYEAIVPMKLRFADGNRHEFPAYVGLSYRRGTSSRSSEGGAVWIPFQMTVYYYSSMERGIHMPFF